MSEKKFITVNGVLQRNPNWRPDAGQTPEPKSTVADPKKALAIVTSPEDAIEATQVLSNATKQTLLTPPATAATIDIIQDDEITKKLNVTDGSLLLDALSKIFAQYEIPIGLLNKLLMLHEYALNFKIDDSGSMMSPTDSTVKEAVSNFMKKRFEDQKRNLDSNMTRLEEVEDRLHLFIEILSYVPTGRIFFSFLNRKETLVLDRTGKTPEQFSQFAHQELNRLFVRPPQGGTPLYQKISSMLAQSSGKTMHYILTDGEPSDAKTHDVGQLVITRQNPIDNPITFLSCTDNDKQAEWMKEIEEVAPFIAELDDFNDEKEEVLHDQGPTFPFSKGFWFLCNLVAAINPDDLDALDESAPFTKGTMENLMGRALSQQEYNQYFAEHPAINSSIAVDPRSVLARYKSHFIQDYQQFCRTDIVAGNIPSVQMFREELRKEAMKTSSYAPFMQSLPQPTLQQSIPTTYQNPQALFGGGYGQPPAALGTPVPGIVLHQQGAPKPF